MQRDKPERHSVDPGSLVTGVGPLYHQPSRPTLTGSPTCNDQDTTATSPQNVSSSAATSPNENDNNRSEQNNKNSNQNHTNNTSRYVSVRRRTTTSDIIIITTVSHKRTNNTSIFRRNNGDGTTSDTNDFLANEASIGRNLGTNSNTIISESYEKAAGTHEKKEQKEVRNLTEICPSRRVGHFKAPC